MRITPVPFLNNYHQNVCQHICVCMSLQNPIIKKRGCLYTYESYARTQLK